MTKLFEHRTTCGKVCHISSHVIVSKDNATSNDEVMMLGVVWIRLRVPMLTLSGQGRVSFTTAIPLFSRRGHNVYFQVEKVKKNNPYM